MGKSMVSGVDFLLNQSIELDEPIASFFLKNLSSTEMGN